MESGCFSRTTGDQERNDERASGQDENRESESVKCEFRSAKRFLLLFPSASQLGWRSERV